MLNDFQTQASYLGFLEINRTGVATENVAATPADILALNRDSTATIFPYTVRTLVDSDGWIDVRSFTNLTILGWALTQNSNILIQSRKSSIDPTTPVAELVATTLLTAAAAPTALYESNTNNITHIRILHSAAASLGGTTNVSIFAR